MLASPQATTFFVVGGSAYEQSLQGMSSNFQLISLQNVEHIEHTVPTHNS